MVEYLKVMAALMVEPAYASLTVEYLKVMAALTVEPAYASLTVEPAYASLSVEPPKGTESLTIHMVRVLSSPSP